MTRTLAGGGQRKQTLPRGKKKVKRHRLNIWFPEREERKKERKGGGIRSEGAFPPEK